MGKITVSEQVIGCIYLHIIGDVIGFGNGKTEFNNVGSKINSETTNLIIYDLIMRGGISGINDLSSLTFSDDTEMHIATIDGYIESRGVDSLEVIKNKFIKLLSKESFSQRAYGKTTINSLNMINRGVPWQKLPYNSEHRGNGAAMRMFCVGLMFWMDSKEERHDLLKNAIELSRMTHNSATGILSGITSALFASYAINGTIIKRWPFDLMAVINSGEIDEIIKETRPDDYVHYNRDKYSYIEAWQSYISKRFDITVVKDLPVLRNLKERVEWFYTNFNPNRFKNKGKGKEYLAETGSTGEDVCIFAYDCLLTCNQYCGDSWESLIYLSTCHVGDSDTVGAIACGLYGALNGAKSLTKEQYKYATDICPEKKIDKFIKMFNIEPHK